MSAEPDEGWTDTMNGLRRATMTPLMTSLMCALITAMLALGGCELAAGCDEARWTTTKAAVTPYALAGTSTELDCPRELDTDALMTARDSGAESSAADYPSGEWERTWLYVVDTQALRDEGNSEGCVYTIFEVVNCGRNR